MKIYDLGYPGQLGRVFSPMCVDLEKSKNIVRGGAIGATESRNLLGTMPGLSILVCMAFRGS